MAYQSDESGAFEVYVRPFPEVETRERLQISAGGGIQPLWSRNGRELFYVTADGALMSVPVLQGPGFNVGDANRVLDVSSYTVGASVGRELRRITRWPAIHADQRRENSRQVRPASMLCSTGSKS